MVTVEALVPDQFQQAAEWLSQPETNRWLTSEWRGRQVDPVTIALVVRNKRNRLFLVRWDGQPCGVVGLADIDPPDRVAMVWYALGEKAFGGKGITTEAVRQVVQRAFAELALRSVYAWIMEDNVGSRRVLEKAGFREAGRIRSATCSADAQVDRVYFDVCSDDPPV